MSIAMKEDLTAESFNEFVTRLRHHVRGEGVSWHGTADAIFTVQAREIIFGIDRDYAENLAVAIEDSMYFSPQEYWDEADEDMRAQLDKTAIDEGDKLFLSLDPYDQWDILGDLPDHTVSGWDERWEYVNSHFTKEAAEAFIARKKHDYRKGLRIYVEAQVYCWEFNAIINGLLDGQIVFAQVATEAAKATGTALQPMTMSYVQNVPDQCDRITWRGAYYHLKEGAEAARQTAPALPVKTWQERIEKDWQSEGFSAMQSEITELRALLASQDKLLRDSVPMHWKDCTSPIGAAQSYIAELESTLAATAAPVLSDAQIGEIADNFKFKDHWQSNAEAIRFARAILAATRSQS